MEVKKEDGSVKYNFNWSVVSKGSPYMTFTSIGINLNSSSVEKLGKPEKVIVGFDEEYCVIGIKPFEGEKGMKSFDFSSRVKNGLVRIGCRSFIKNLKAMLGIDFSSAKRFMAQYDRNKGILFVSLRDGGK